MCNSFQPCTEIFLCSILSGIMFFCVTVILFCLVFKTGHLNNECFSVTMRWGKVPVYSHVYIVEKQALNYKISNPQFPGPHQHSKVNLKSKGRQLSITHTYHPQVWIQPNVAAFLFKWAVYWKTIFTKGWFLDNRVALSLMSSIHQTSQISKEQCFLLTLSWLAFSCSFILQFFSMTGILHQNIMPSVKLFSVFGLIGWSLVPPNVFCFSWRSVRKCDPIF